MSSPASSSSSLSDFPIGTSSKTVVNNEQQLLHGKEVKCECESGQLVPVRVSLLLQCGAFKKTVQDLGLLADQLTTDFVFPVRSISMPTLYKIVRWMEHREGKPEPVVEMNPMTGTQKWFSFDDFETNFYKIGIHELSALLMATRFLDLNSLYLYSTQALAALMDSKTPEQIRELFGIEDDLTEEQKEQIRQKNVWCHFAA